MTIVPGEIKTAQLHAYLLGAIAPRPICFASTMDSNGVSNLAPFSFFNVFGSKPPVLIFSPSRRVRDNTIKHIIKIKFGDPIDGIGVHVYGDNTKNKIAH